MSVVARPYTGVNTIITVYNWNTIFGWGFFTVYLLLFLFSFCFNIFKHIHYLDSVCSFVCVGFRLKMIYIVFLCMYISKIISNGAGVGCW